MILRWFIYMLCLSVLAGAMGWMSLRMLSMDSERRAAAQDAQVQEKVRLALWRMDSLASALLIRENSRPPQHYQSFYAPEELFASGTQSLPKGSALTPSPLFGPPPDLVQLHFEEANTMNCTSPQVPVGQQLTLADNWYANGSAMTQAKTKLAELSQLLAKHPSLRTVSPQTVKPLLQKQAVSMDVQIRLNAGELNKRAVILDQNLVVQKTPAPAKKSIFSKELKSSATEKVNEALTSVASRYKAVEEPAAPAPIARPILPPLAGDLKPYWAGTELLLVRQATVDGVSRLQGVWLDWPALRSRMIAAISDLLPAASLLPVSTDSAAAALVTLPVELLPGRVEVLTEQSPLRSALFIAWACLLAAAAAIAFVLHRAMRLSERRGAFVSAVTHELRTPLTTFRLYSEMLADDMVPEPEKRRSYLNTLCEESTRLMHLVENVLSYSRIERGRTAGRMEQVALSRLLERITPRLLQRAQSCGLKLLVELPENAAAVFVMVDPLAVEQILFNLTDNACKYAAPDCTRQVLLLRVEECSTGIAVSLRDYGPGLSSSAVKKLFQPFAKSATEAAHSAPGVGLGLALCRRLATELDGKLEHVPIQDRGCCFRLTLPTKG